MGAIATLLALFLVSAAPSAGAAEPFLTSRDVDLLQILSPPPAGDSPQTRSELGEVLALQVARTPAMETRARADMVEDIWRFAEVVGPGFTAGALPKLAAFFERVAATEGAVVDPAKNAWNRPRPYQLSDLVRPAVKASSSGAYPSGHTTVGTMMGILLANMLPEKRAAIMSRAWEYGENRIIGGAHYRSDVVAGRIAGSVIVWALMSRPDARAAFEAARRELRTKMRLP